MMRGHNTKCFVMSLYAALLFVLLSPGVIISLPPRGSLITKALVHGLVFLVVFHCTKKLIRKCFRRGYRENFEDREDFEDDE